MAGREGCIGGAVTLSAAYVSQHVELGYASTVHRAQGLTVETAQAVIDTNTATRELLSVAMTRGAEANHVCVASDSPADDHVPHSSARTTAARLVDVLARVGARRPEVEWDRAITPAPSLTRPTFGKRYRAT